MLLCSCISQGVRFDVSQLVSIFSTFINIEYIHNIEDTGLQVIQLDNFTGKCTNVMVR